MTRTRKYFQSALGLAPILAGPWLFAQTLPVQPPTTPTPVSVVIFSDFECPYSSDLFFNLQRIQSSYGQQLHVIWKQSPLPIHPEAPLAHKAALAAAKQGRYNQMAELLYANEAHLDRASLLSYARHVHLDMARFQRDLDSAGVAAQLDADMEESRAFAIQQTPTLFINGKGMIGVQSEKTLAAAIDKAGELKTKTATSTVSDETPLTPALAAELLVAPIASKGSASAPLTIVEFTDFQCPYCRSAVGPMEDLMAARGQQVRWIFRAFPLDFHPESEISAEAALAAGEQGKFWEMHDLLFSHQSALKLEDLRTYAMELRLDMTAFDQALSTHRFAGQIAADRALGVKAGVNGTPTFFVDGQPMTGARSLPELNQMADAHATPAAIQATAGAAAVSVAAVAVPDQQVLGPGSGAPVTLTWYVDVRSPLAGRQAELIQRLAKQYDGRVRVLFRAFALESHADSRLSSAALLAALKQDKFWQMYGVLAERRDTLDHDKLVAIADALKLDHAGFAAEFDAANADVTRDINDGVRRGIQGAPVVFINDKRVDGLQADRMYTTIVDSQLKIVPPVEASLQQ